jgi:signal peptidase I
MDSVKNFISNTVILIGVTLACYLLLGQVIEVSGVSMEPNVKNGEFVVAEKISPKFGGFSRGEIVVIKSPENPNRLLIKRIIGLPTESVKIAGHYVYVNNRVLVEKYLDSDVITLGGQMIRENTITTLGEDEYLMLGDNRENSTDSRDYGAINKESVLGRALFVYKPIQNFRLLILQ